MWFGNSPERSHFRVRGDACAVQANLDPDAASRGPPVKLVKQFVRVGSGEVRTTRGSSRNRHSFPRCDLFVLSFFVFRSLHAPKRHPEGEGRPGNQPSGTDLMEGDSFVFGSFLSSGTSVYTCRWTVVPLSRGWSRHAEGQHRVDPFAGFWLISR